MLIIRYFLQSWKKKFDFYGVTTGLEYFSFILMTAINLFIDHKISCLLNWHIHFLFFDWSFSLGIFETIYFIYSLLPLFSVSGRRLHDLGYSDKWCIPIIFIFSINLIANLFLLFKPSKLINNPYRHLAYQGNL